MGRGSWDYLRTSGDGALPGSPGRAEGVARRESSWGIALPVSGKTNQRRVPGRLGF